MNDSSKALSDQVFHRFLRLLRYVRQQARQMKGKGIGPRDFAVLRYLLEEGPATVGEVRVHLQKSPSTTSTLIADLEEAGYVTRTRSKKDNRVVLVELTSTGQNIAQNTPLTGLPLLRRQLRTLPQERLQLIDGVLAEILGLMEVTDSG